METSKEQVKHDALEYINENIDSVFKSMLRHQDIVVRFSPLKEKHERLLRNAHDLTADDSLDSIVETLKTADGITLAVARMYFRKSDFAYIHVQADKKWHAFYPKLADVIAFRKEHMQENCSPELTEFLQTNTMQQLRDIWDESPYVTPGK